MGLVWDSWDGFEVGQRFVTIDPSGTGMTTNPEDIYEVVTAEENTASVRRDGDGQPYRMSSEWVRSGKFRLEE